MVKSHRPTNIQINLRSRKFKTPSNRLMVGRWSKGRPVYKKFDGEPRYLFVQNAASNWAISESLDGQVNWMVSGSATNCPAQPEAAPSKRNKVNGWRYYNGTNWKEVPGTSTRHKT